jgi:hypothetical protein
MQVLCIQNERTRSSAQLNSMPCPAGMDVRYIRPRACSFGCRATSTLTRGCPGAVGKLTVARSSAGAGSGSLGQMLAGCCGAGASAGVSTRQGRGSVLVPAAPGVAVFGVTVFGVTVFGVAARVPAAAGAGRAGAAPAASVG